MKMEIHRAKPDDAAALAELNDEFNRVLMPVAEIRRRLVSNQKELVLIATVAGAAAGYVCLQFSRSMCYSSDWAEITEMYVRARFRRKGVGAALLRAVERAAARRHVDKVIVLTGGRNSPGQALYSSANYRQTRKLVYSKALANTASKPIAAKRGSG
jgi:GNAT superfamily N-acetyltransferase